MTKKNYAAILSAKELIAEAEKITEEALHSPTSTYKAVKEINKLCQKWNADFKDCDPNWQPPENNNSRSIGERAANLSGYIQESA